jgi:hypothetical protein
MQKNMTVAMALITRITLIVRPAFVSKLILSDEALTSGTILVTLAAIAITKVFVLTRVWTSIDEVAATNGTDESTD